MSAASFISLAGGLSCRASPGTESQPAAWPMSWVGPGGFRLCPAVAPRLRQMGLDTIPDFFGATPLRVWPPPHRRAGGRAVFLHLRRGPDYGVGLISSRLTGVHFEIGILLGLGGRARLFFSAACGRDLDAGGAIRDPDPGLPDRCPGWPQAVGQSAGPLVSASSWSRSPRWRNSWPASPAEQEVIQGDARRHGITSASLHKR